MDDDELDEVEIYRLARAKAAADIAAEENAIVAR